MYVTCTDSRNTVVFRTTDIPHKPAQYIRFLNDCEYMILATGEIREYVRHEKRSLYEIHKSFGRLREIINCNYQTPEQVRFVTLTYRYDVSNALIRRHMSNFLRRIKDAFPVSPFRYIYVKELTEKGRWHIHLILFFDCPSAPFMPNDLVADCWKQGFVNIQGFDGSINNLGNYITAMLVNHDSSKDKGTSSKASRINNYPRDVRLWNASRNIYRPLDLVCDDSTEYYMVESEKLELLSSCSYFVSINGKDVKVIRNIYCRPSEFVPIYD